MRTRPRNCGFRTLACLSLLLLCCAVAVYGQTAAKKKPPAKLEISPDEQALIDLTNKERAKERLAPLKPNAKLFKAARDHAKNMADQDMMLHDFDGKGTQERLDAVGYRYLTGGENIAKGLKDFEKLMEGWMASEQHKANIRNQKFVEIGIGIAHTEKGKPYYTQVFGTPKR